MTQYSLPETPEVIRDQETLVDVPPADIDKDYMSYRTWRDKEPEDTGQPESDVGQQEESVARFLGRSALKIETGRGDHDRFITTFRWVPYSKQESTIALKRLGKHVDIAGRTKHGSGERAVENVFSQVDKFRADAVDTIAGLKEALTTIDEDDLSPSVRAIKQNQRVRTEMAKYMWSKESLASLNWHPRRTNKGPNRKTQNRLRELNQLLDSATDDELVQLWREAVITNRMRLVFWRKQVDVIKGVDTATPLTEEDRQLGAEQARRMVKKLTRDSLNRQEEQENSLQA